MVGRSLPRKEQIGQLKHQLARALADYQNLQKRVARESHDIVRRENRELLGRLLGVLDILEKAGSHTADEGLALAVTQFKQVLSDFGVKEIEVRAQDKFDPRLHEAVDVVLGKKEGLIAEVVSKGYKFAEEVLRPARVKVFGKTAKKGELEKELLRGDYV